MKISKKFSEITIAEIADLQAQGKEIEVDGDTETVSFDL